MQGQTLIIPLEEILFIFFNSQPAKRWCPSGWENWLIGLFKITFVGGKCIKGKYKTKKKKAINNQVSISVKDLILITLRGV